MVDKTIFKLLPLGKLAEKVTTKHKLQQGIHNTTLHQTYSTSPSTRELNTRTSTLYHPWCKLLLIYQITKTMDSQ